MVSTIDSVGWMCTVWVRPLFSGSLISADIRFICVESVVVRNKFRIDHFPKVLRHISNGLISILSQLHDIDFLILLDSSKKGITDGCMLSENENASCGLKPNDGQRSSRVEELGNARSIMRRRVIPCWMGDSHIAKEFS